MSTRDIILLIFGIAFYTLTVALIVRKFSGSKKRLEEAKRSSRNLEAVIGNFNFISSARKESVFTNEQNCERIWNILDVGTRYTDSRREHVYEVINKDYDNGALTVRAITTFSYLELPDYVAVYEPKEESEREEYREDLKRKEVAQTINRKFD